MRDMKKPLGETPKSRSFRPGIYLGLAALILPNTGCRLASEIGDFVAHEAHVYSVRAGNNTKTYSFRTSDGKFHDIELGGKQYLGKKKLVETVVKHLPYEFVRHTHRIYFETEEEFDEGCAGHAHNFFNDGTNCIELPGYAKIIIHEFAHQWFDNLSSSAQEEFKNIDKGLYGTLLKPPKDSFTLPSKWSKQAKITPAGEKGPGPNAFVSAYARSTYTESIAEHVEELLCFTHHKELCDGKDHTSGYTTIHKNRHLYSEEDLNRLDKRVRFFFTYAGKSDHIREKYEQVFKRKPKLHSK